MRINLGSVDVTEHERRAIAFWGGTEGLATRDDCRTFIRENGLGAISDAVIEYDQEHDA